MSEVRVPKLNANDTTYILVEWLVGEGEQVRPGDPVAVVETSKAAEELASEAAGFVQIVAPAGAECGVGEVIARLHATGGPWPAGGPHETEPGTGSASGTLPPGSIAPAPAHPGPPNGSGGAARGVLITGPARALIEQHGLAEARVQALSRRVVRREDIEALLRSAPAESDPADPVTTDPADPVTAEERVAPDRPRRELSRGQRAVAAVVTESHRTVPAAYVAVKVRVGPALVLARELSRQHRCLIGLPELVMKSVAAQHDDFPLGFAHPLDPATVALSDAAHVGITVDVGKGLQVPVVHHTARRSWRELGRSLMDFRVTALRGAFRPAQLTGGNIIVALHNDEDVVFAVPLIFPGQVCAVSLGATQTELVLAPDGAVVSEPVVHLGLAYDHRVINGGDAVAFLQAVKRLLNAPERLATLGAGPAAP